MLGGRHAQRHGTQFGLTDGIEQTKTHIGTSAALWNHATCQHGIGANGTDTRQIGPGAFRQRRHTQTDEAEQPATLEVGPHHVGNRTGHGAFVLKKGNGNRKAAVARASDLDRELGMGAYRNECRCADEKRLE